jgi:hypothetical protein
MIEFLISAPQVCIHHRRHASRAARVSSRRVFPVSLDRRKIMKLVTKLLLVLALAVILGTGASAQVLMENHYKVYNITPPYTYSSPTGIILHDQFGQYIVNNLLLDRFANPVEKQHDGQVYPILFPEVHQTWWSLNYPTPGWDVEVENQFGTSVWHVGDVRYLVLPALKDVAGPPPIHNHYLAYQASGPAENIPLVLTDQWGTVTAVAAEPAMFLNPVEKIADGQVYPIVDPVAHLACYWLQPPISAFHPAVAYDQFGIWQFEALDHCWLCVPSYKRLVVGTESRTWGDIKALYHH